MTPTPPPDAAVAVVTVDAAIALARPDARRVHPIDAAPTIALAPDATAELAVVVSDAAPAPPPDAPAATAAILVINDTWCEVMIDDSDRGRLARTSYPVTPGHHHVVCAQPGTTRSWTVDLDVAAGETGNAQGEMLPAFKVTVAVAHGVSINGTFHPDGDVVQLKPNRYEIRTTGSPEYLDLHRACTLRDHVVDDGTTRVDCFP